MTREEMLQKLQSITPGVELTILPTEGALECEYVTKEGCSYEWIGMHDWPVVKLNGIQEDYIKTIIKKLVTRSLTFGDIEGTVFNDLYFNFYSSSDNDEEKDIAKEQMLLNCAFESLINVQLTENGEIFAIYDTYSDAPSFEFFGDYELMTTVFGEKYLSVDTRWEDLDDDDLSQWLDRLEENYQGIPFACLGPDEEEE